MQAFCLWARNLLAKAPLPEVRRKWGESRVYYFYSLQSSSVIKSKMAATTTLRTRTRFHPRKIRLHCSLNEVCRLILRPQNCVPGKTNEIRGFVTAVGTVMFPLFRPFPKVNLSPWVSTYWINRFAKRGNWLSRIHCTFFFHCLLLNV